SPSQSYESSEISPASPRRAAALFPSRSTSYKTTPACTLPPKAARTDTGACVKTPRGRETGNSMNVVGRTHGAKPVRTDSGAPLVVVDDVTLQYKTADHLVTATWKVGFEVHEADRYILLGPSGCGKTTILKAIGGFMAPVAGSITLNGRPIERPGPDRMMVFQEFDQLLPWRTVLGNVLFPLLVN